MSKHRKHQHAREPERPSGLATLQPWKQDGIAILALYIITLILFRAIVFDKAAFAEAGDTAAAVAYEQVAKRIQTDDGITDVLWVPYFFSGMPTFGNFAIVPRAVSYAQQAMVWLLDFFYLKGPWTWLVVFYFPGRRLHVRRRQTAGVSSSCGVFRRHRLHARPLWRRPGR